MDKDYQFWYGVKVWRQTGFFEVESLVDILQDGGHIILKETNKFLCKRKAETVIKNMGFDKEKIVDRRIENTDLCPKCLAEWTERETIHRKMPISVTYETNPQTKTVPAV